MNKLFTALALSATLLIACGQQLHYPTIGVKNNRVRPTNWAGDLMKKCCLPVVQVATGKQIYVCKHQTVPECVRLARESRR
jgi:hypothetical protein